MRRRGRLDTWPAVIAIYALASVVFTWPLAFYATSRLPAGANDIWQNLWNFWWWREALLSLGSNPYATAHLFHPHGTSLVLHTHSTFNQIVAFPVNALMGEVAALNFATLLGFALAGIAAHHLAYDLTRNRGAAYVAGFVFAYFPHHLEQSLEHLNLSSIQFLPWVALYGLRVAGEGNRRDALLLGLVFALNALSCWHYALFTLFFLPILFIEAWSREGNWIARARSRLALLCISAGVVIVIMAPFAVGMLTQASVENTYVKPPVEKGIDIAFLFVPSDQHPLFGSFTQTWYRTHRSYPALGSQSYLGYAALLLAALALRRPHRDRAVVAWLAIFVTGWMLALGSNITVFGQPTRLPGPHALFEHLPLLASLRVANRFIVIAMLALAMLAAFGISRRLAGRKHAATIFCAAIAIEFLWLPYPTQPVDFSPILDQLAGEGSGAVLDIPLSDRSPAAPNLAAQTRHGRPIAGGYISVKPTGDAALARDPVLAALSGFVPQVPARIDVDHLRRLGFHYVVLHKDRTLAALGHAYARLDESAGFYQRRRYEGVPGMPEDVFERISSRFEAALGAPSHEDDRLRVFRLVSAHDDSPGANP